MRIKIIIFLFFFVVSVTGYAQDVFDTLALKKHVTLLSSDEFGGRSPGTAGGQKAAEYVQQEFKNAGLTLLYTDGYQPFTLKVSKKMGKEASFILNGKSYIPEIDFAHHVKTPDINTTGNIIFVGYGIEDTYRNDFSPVEIKGKWVMIITGGATSFPEKALLSKLGKIAKKGGKGIILVDPVKENPLDTLVPENFNLFSFHLPIIQIKRTLADSLLTGVGLRMDSIGRGYNQEEVFFSKDLTVSFSYNSDIITAPVEGRNVIGLLQGSDETLQKEYVVIGAHFDHLGMRFNAKEATAKIFHGADDNASGVGSLIELAKQFVRSKEGVKRSLLFVAFDAEEKGLVGSSFFIKNLPPDIRKTDIVSMINLDMIGRYRDDVGLYIAGTDSYKDGELLLNWIKEETSMSVIPNNDFFNASDHLQFYRRKIPVLFFFTGLHSDYHKPEDRSEKIDYRKMEEITKLTYSVIKKIGNQEKRSKHKSISY